MSLSDSSTSENVVETVSDQPEQPDYQFGISHSSIVSEKSPAGKGLKLYCFSCHRQETHFSALKGQSHHYLLVGMTFGMILLFGPYRCRCCGHKRLCKYNFLNLRYHLHRRKYTRSSTSSSSTSSSSTSSSSTSSSSTSSSSTSSRSRTSRKDEDPDSVEYSNTFEKEWSDGDKPKKRRRKRRRLKSVPIVESIGKDRREQRKTEMAEQLQGGDANFTMDGLLSSFETEQSLKAKAAEAKANKPEFVGKKAKPRKKVSGKPKRRHAKKTRLKGPKIYCFSCKQNIEHFHHLKTSNFYSFFFGITLGLISLIGPYRCSVCTHKRLFGLNILHPKFFVRRFLEQAGEGYK